ncbi:unnamed protein product [Ambrosiozyma monospora]|uniref:Unnamed protein product n=1 Tax=Ambrosiozyma monospora TaxID=43982 RepID=A0A9W6TAU7_AMBMO|nr:unnamed protein product [Ambrosiozyma monospora]
MNARLRTKYGRSLEVGRGTTTRLNSKYAPTQITQQALIGNIMPAQYLVKFNIFIEILLKINSHHFHSTKRHIRTLNTDSNGEETCLLSPNPNYNKLSLFY